MKVTLKNLPVKTKSGIDLGSIRDIILDTESHTILQYEVGNLLSKKYLINREQVVYIDNEKMVVDDNVVKIESKNVIKNKINIEPEGVTMDQSL